MKPLQFRAWHKTEKQMFEVVGWKKMEWHGDWLSDVEAFNIRRPTNQLEWVSPSEIELLEYTGVRDRKNRNIYEGDIIEYYRPPKEIFSEEGEQRGVLTRDAVIYGECGYFCAEQYYQEPLMVLNEECEIIGNIYETPTLAEKTDTDLPN